MAEVLRDLGADGAWVVHGEGGLDEVSPWGPTNVAQLDAEGRVRTLTVTPEDFGVTPVSVDGIRGGDAGRNADIVRSVLRDEQGPALEATVLNAGAALRVSGERTDLTEAADLARQTIASGAAERLLDRLITMSAEG
jgi:anthranilate phosphoribosyltransferase